MEITFYKGKLLKYVVSRKYYFGSWKRTGTINRRLFSSRGFAYKRLSTRKRYSWSSLVELTSKPAYSWVVATTWRALRWYICRDVVPSTSPHAALVLNSFADLCTTERREKWLTNTLHSSHWFDLMSWSNTQNFFCLRSSYLFILFWLLNPVQALPVQDTTNKEKSSVVARPFPWKANWMKVHWNSSDIYFFFFFLLLIIYSFRDTGPFKLTSEFDTCQLCLTNSLIT